MIMSNISFVKSPLNYTGNKYRILEQIVPLFPKKIDCMVDLFCGGATVGLNTNAKKIIFVDSNKRVINLLIYLSQLSFEEALIRFESVIEKYKLSYSYKYGYSKYRSQCKDQKDNNGLKEYNSVGFYKLRDDYNAIDDKDSDEANTMLYILMVYAFNNDIRFNSDGHFNLPVGKTDLNKMNVLKIKNYIERINTIEAEFVCMDFNSEKLMSVIQNADFVYMDPPYLVGDAVYNASWNNEKEYKLLDFIDVLRKKKINFALSNVTCKVGKTNEPLSYWCYKNQEYINVNKIEYNYRSASYNKINRDAKEQEVLVTNKEYYDENK